MKRISAIRWTMVWMLVGLLGFVCSGFATERASGAWMGDGLRNGEKRTITLPGGATMDLVWVEPGSFDMDSDYRVVLTKGYWIGKFEVTQKQWQSVMGNNPSHFKGDDLPVECVSWNDCQEFFEKVNSMNPALRVSLPTEAQWAFAARGGTRSLGFEYAGSNNPKEVGWFEENSGGLFSSRKTHPVGKKKPNELGLYDMSGNVWEWCQDWYGDYPSGAVADPTGLSSGGRRVNRGGSWLNYARFCRSAHRDRNLPDLRYGILGFRVVASAGTVTDGGSPGREPATARPPKPAERAGAGATERASGAWMGGGKKNGDVRTITLPGGATMDLVWVEPGSFQMGSNDSDAYDSEKPVHKVTLTKGYWIGKTEVTQKQWKSVMGGNPFYFKGDDNCPVEKVSWNDCQEFLTKVNAAVPELRLALPTEAQWEFAARGGPESRGFKYAGSDDPKEVAWFNENSGGLFSFRKTHPVGKKKPNELGLYDMSGNVWEWCQDWYGDYPSGAVADPTGLSSGDYRVLRGGSWLDNARCCRSANRGGFNPGYRDDILGFRVVASAGP